MCGCSGSAAHLPSSCLLGLVPGGGKYSQMLSVADLYGTLATLAGVVEIGRVCDLISCCGKCCV